MEQHNIIYRVTVSGLHCRSSVDLVNLKVSALEGVQAASIGPDNVLTVFADAESVSAADIVRVLIDTGVLPDGGVFALPLESPETLEIEPVREEAAAEVEPALAEVAVEIEPILEEAAVEVEPVLTAVAVEEAPVQAEVSVEADPVPAVAAVAAEPVQAEVEESIRADIDTPHAVASPRASLVQRIKVTVSDDYYPNLIEVIPGVPVDVEFSEGYGCLSRVVFDEFGIDADLTDGGATISLPGLTPGTHEFTCGRRMVRGAVVARI